LLILVVVIVVTARGGGQLFLGLRRRTDFVLVQSDEVANDTVVELESSLVLGQGSRLGGELGDDIVAVLAGADGVGELSPPPMRDFGLLFGGDVNGRFRAFDQRSGKVLWEINLGSPVTGYPISYAVDGKQYVAVSTGVSLTQSGLSGLTPELRPSTGNNLFVFALP
jgi:outer membrane protein assembly factor BamB